MVDKVIYWLIMGLLLLCIAWLLLIPAPGHEPLITLTHAGLVQ